MLKSIALLAPVALIVAVGACAGGDPSSTGEDEQGTPGVSSADEALTSVTVKGGERGRGAQRVERGRHFERQGRNHGWVHGGWAPGWGWIKGKWVQGGTVQYSCTYDTDCDALIGAGAAVCDFYQPLGVGQCVAPNWL